MKISYEERCLKAVKKRYVLFGRECYHCQAKVKQEKMWKLYVEPSNPLQIFLDEIYFCQNCAKTREDVLKINTRTIHL